MLYSAVIKTMQFQRLRCIVIVSVWWLKSFIELKAIYEVNKKSILLLFFFVVKLMFLYTPSIIIHSIISSNKTTHSFISLLTARTNVQTTTIFLYLMSIKVLLLTFTHMEKENKTSGLMRVTAIVREINRLASSGPVGRNYLRGHTLDTSKTPIRNACRREGYLYWN